MNFDENWQDKALCTQDEDPSRWISSERPDIVYAVHKCNECTVRKECLVSAWASSDGSWFGIRAGLTEYDYLNNIWKEVTDDSETNWSRDDSVLQRLLREV